MRQVGEPPQLCHPRTVNPPVLTKMKVFLEPPTALSFSMVTGFNAEKLVGFDVEGELVICAETMMVSSGWH